MVHGTADTDVPYQESADMAAALEDRGVPHELITVEGGGHGIGNVAQSRFATPPSPGDRIHPPAVAVTAALSPPPRARELIALHAEWSCYEHEAQHRHTAAHQQSDDRHRAAFRVAVTGHADQGQGGHQSAAPRQAESNRCWPSTARGQSSPTASNVRPGRAGKNPVASVRGHTLDFG